MGFQEKYLDWVDQRTGCRQFISRITSLPLAGKPSLQKTIFFVLVTVVLFQAVTGCFLALSYSPGVSTAYLSVKFQMQETTAGHLLRSLHAYGAHLIVILLFFCLVEKIATRGYRTPGEVKWILGLLMGGFLVLIATTGYLLPWDQYGYWGTKVRTSILGSVPILGPILKTIALGGAEIGNLTLTRFYTLHALVFPAILSILFLAYLSSSIHLRTRPKMAPGAFFWWPDQAWRDALCGALVFLALYAVSVIWPVFLGSIANPMETYPARPEWYFRWLFQTLKFFPPPFEIIGTVLIPHLILLFFFLVPWIDSNKRSSGKLVIPVFVLLLAAVGGLTGLSVWEDVKTGHFKEVALWETEPASDFDSAGFYKKECARCHGRNGAGLLDNTPDFTSGDYWSGTPSDIRLLKVILDGVPNQHIPEDERMPAYASKLSPSEAKSLLVDKIYSFKPKTSSD